MRQAKNRTLRFENLENRIALDATTISFERDQATAIPTASGTNRSGTLESLSYTRSGLNIELKREGGRFDIVENSFSQQKPSAFGSKSLDPFSTTSNTPFVMNFDKTVDAVFMLMGDYGEDSPDLLQLEAFSGPDATGDLLSEDEANLPTIGNDEFNFKRVSVQADGIRSVRFIGGTSAFPNSTFVDRIRIEFDPTEWLPDLVGESITYHVRADAGYKLTGTPVFEGPVPANAKVDVTFRMTNKGQTVAATSRVIFYASDDSMIERSDVRLGAEVEPELQPNQSYEISRRLQLPSTIENSFTKWIWLGTILNATNVVAESDEANNSNFGRGVDRVHGDLYDSLPVVSTRSGFPTREAAVQFLERQGYNRVTAPIFGSG